MKPLFALLLVCLAVLLSRGDAPTSSPAAEDVELTSPYDFARLTAQQARTLDSSVVRFKVCLDSAEDTEGRWTVFDCKSSDDVIRTIWLFPADQETAPLFAKRPFSAAGAARSGTASETAHCDRPPARAIRSRAKVKGLGTFLNNL